jgi:hypothetical protein
VPDQDPLPPLPDGVIVFDFRTSVLPLGKSITALRHASIRRALELYESQEEAAAALGIPMTLFPAAVKEMQGIPERPERPAKPSPPDPKLLEQIRRDMQSQARPAPEPAADVTLTLASAREACELLNQLATVAKKLSAVLDKAASGRG